jgi:hypothetical protein
MEVKQEIAQLISQLPDAVQVELLGYLRQLAHGNQDKMHRSIHLQTILAADEEVLVKLSK